MKNSSNPNIVLVYDRLNSRGGAEEVLAAFHRVFPKAPIATSVYSKQHLPNSLHTIKVLPSFLQHIPFLRTQHRLLGWLMPFIFLTFSFPKSQTVISITSEYAKAVRAKGVHICYLLTPTRYLWSHPEQYRNWITQKFGDPGGIGFDILRKMLKMIDLWLSSFPTEYVAISKLVANRLSTYYGRSASRVIYPPVNTVFYDRKFVTDPLDTSELDKQYLIWVGRLVQYKEVELVIKSAIKASQLLYIIGDGPDRNLVEKYQSEFPNLIRYLGFVSDVEKRRYMANALGYVHVAEEDFGITAIEAVSLGIPIVVHSNSGCTELLNMSKVGVVVNELNTETVSKAMSSLIRNIRRGLYTHSYLRSQARQYDTVEFENNWKEFLCKTTSTF